MGVGTEDENARDYKKDWPVERKEIRKIYYLGSKNKKSMSNTVSNELLKKSANSFEILALAKNWL